VNVGDSSELLRTVVRTDADVLALRRTGREVAERLGLEPQDQVRVATALSEVGRSAAANGGGMATVTVREDSGGSTLVITVTTTVTMPVLGPVTEGGVPAARQLLDDVDVRSGPPTEVVLTKALPAKLTRASLDALRTLLGSDRNAEAIDEMRAQNAELVRMLDALTVSARELKQVNAELEETNRGVLAMYRQLSDELEETNTGVVALYAELDERGRQLSAANEAKTRFLRNVSHELRTPVNSILGLASLLADSPLDREQRRQVNFLQDSAAALLGLVNELLDLARAESGRQEVTVTAVDLVELLEELRGTTEPLVRDGVRLEILRPEITTVRTDRRLLTRVLRNLLTNAVKFTDQGHVRLAARLDRDGEGRDWVRFAVEDTGLGIAPELLEEVFEEFYQIPNRLQPSVRGTGLGLPYARRSMQTLGGALDVTSTPGQGSTFTASLPLISPGELESGEIALDEAAIREAMGEPQSTSAGTLADASDQGESAALVDRALVVDDDDAYRAVVADLLRGTAGNVVQAGSAQEAFARSAEARPDIVLLDVRMPDVDGIVAMARLRAERPGLPVVHMSSGPPPDLPPGSGDVPFIAKAEITRATLREAFRRALSSTTTDPSAREEKDQS
jgi:signal transduction histidine kinase/CheY-like chemotaxis protein